MFMMFMYIDDKVINSMGIRGELDELYTIAGQEAKKVFKENPHGEFRIKITMYI